MKKITLLLLLVGSQFLQSQVTANSPSPIIICELDTDGYAVFDLTWADAEIIGAQTDVMLTYHVTFSDAENGLFPISNTSAYVNTTPNFQTVYPRVESIINGEYAITELLLIVGSIPNTNTPLPIILIDADEDGFEIFDLTIRENEIADPTQNYTFSYFELLVDAETNIFPLDDPSVYQNMESPEQTIYVRVDDMESGCYAIEPLLIVVDTIPDVPVLIVEDFVVFDEDGDGVAIFDFTLMIPQIVGDQTGLEVTFYETELDAENKTNAVEDPETYENIVNPQTMYARTETIYGTFALTSFTIFADENLSLVDSDAVFVNFYPNPVGDFIQINMKGINQDYRIEIISMNGHVILTNMENSQTALLDVSELNSGIYFLKIILANKQITKKLIKQ